MNTATLHTSVVCPAACTDTFCVAFRHLAICRNSAATLLLSVCACPPFCSDRLVPPLVLPKKFNITSDITIHASDYMDVREFCLTV